MTTNQSDKQGVRERIKGIVGEATRYCQAYYNEDNDIVPEQVADAIIELVCQEAQGMKKDNLWHWMNFEAEDIDNFQGICDPKDRPENCDGSSAEYVWNKALDDLCARLKGEKV